MKKSKIQKEKSNEIVLKRSCFDFNDSSINFVFSLIIPTLAAIVLAIVFAFFATFSGSSYNEFVKTNLAMVISLIYTPTVFFLIYFIYSKKRNIDIFKASDIKFKIDWKKAIVVAVIAVASVFLISPFISLLDHVYSLIGYNPSNSLPYVMNNGWRYVLGIMIMAVVPAIFEELLFRGLIYKGLTKKLSPHVAIIIAAIMFMLLHGSLQQTVYQFILGIMLGYAMYFGKSILYPMILHFVNNFIVVTMSFIYTMQGVDVNKPMVYDGAWAYIYPILLALLGAAVIVGLIFLLKFLNGNKKLKENSENVASNETISNINNNETTKKVVDTENSEEILKSDLNENLKVKKSFNSKLDINEKFWFYGGLCLGVVLWIVNTVTAFF